MTNQEKYINKAIDIFKDNEKTKTVFVKRIS